MNDPYAETYNLGWWDQSELLELMDPRLQGQL